MLATRPHSRVWLIDHHQAVIDELRHDVQGGVLRDEEDAEHYAIRIAPEDDDA